MACQVRDVNLLQGLLFALLLWLEGKRHLLVARVCNQPSTSVAAYKVANALLFIIIIIIKNVRLLTRFV